MLFLVQKPLALANETVPGEGQFQDKTWKEVIEEILTKNDISADKIALGNKNIVTEEDPTATPIKAGMPAEKESHVRKEEEE